MPIHLSCWYRPVLVNRVACRENDTAGPTRLFGTVSDHAKHSRGSSRQVREHGARRRDAESSCREPTWPDELRAEVTRNRPGLWCLVSLPPASALYSQATLSFTWRYRAACDALGRHVPVALREAEPYKLEEIACLFASLAYVVRVQATVHRGVRRPDGRQRTRASLPPLNRLAYPTVSKPRGCVDQ